MVTTIIHPPISAAPSNSQFHLLMLNNNYHRKPNPIEIGNHKTINNKVLNILTPSYLIIDYLQ